ncbi:MAG TPA: alginate export family protein [Prolixibacteraceae bacterium]|nr:alginate export family protein [Prolixibacteraceae bacterium]
MKKIFALLSFGLVFLLSFSESYGQVTIDAEFRPRSEYRQGFNQPLADTLKSSGFTLQRTRLNFNYTSGLLNARLTLQDARVFGETNTKQPSTASNRSLGIYEAWAELLLGSGTSFKIGRQGVQFEDGRLFSLSPWSNTGNSHDLAQLRYSATGFEAQLGYAYGNEKAYNADTSYYSISKMYKQLAFLHLTKTITNGLDLSLLGIDEGFMKSKTDQDLYHRYTTGGTLQLKKDNLPLGIFATGYYQFGKSTPTVDLDAYLLALKTTYKFTDKIGVLAGIDYYSGSENTLASTKTKTFNKLPYGVNHSFNGYMEYWASLPKGGLMNYFGGVNLKITKKLSSVITYYSYRLDKNMKSGTTEVKKNIGSELDIVMNYKFSPETAIQFAWCGYFVNDATRMLKLKSTSVETKFPQYAYIMLTIKPKFYKTPVVAK